MKSGLILPFLLALLVPRTALGQSADGPVCAPVERELAAAKEELERARQMLRASERALATSQATNERLLHAEAKLSQATAAASACELAKQSLCGATSEFARGIGSGRLDVTGLGECVGPDHQRAVAEQLGALHHANQVLAQLNAYASGESDRAPQAKPGATTLEKALARLVPAGNRGTPLFYQRLLSEALALMAPKRWARIRAAEGNRLDAWFTSDEPLDPELVAEAQRGADSSRASVPLATALQLVQVFDRLVNCSDPKRAPRACARAAQIEQLLQSSGPLLVRRRVQTIWSTDCSDLDGPQLLRWIRELPTTQQLAAGGEDEQAIVEAAATKLYGCFLRDSDAGTSYTSWLSHRWPTADSLLPHDLARLDAIRGTFAEGGLEDRCARATRAMQTAPPPSSCALDASIVEPVRAWAEQAAAAESGASGPRLRMCGRLARALWEGRAATVPGVFPTVPLADDAVTTLTDAPPTSMARLRTLCGSRVGTGAQFADGLSRLAHLAETFGESITDEPWRLDSRAKQPVEASRYAEADQPANYVAFLMGRGSGCDALGLDPDRCAQCRELAKGAFFDCVLVDRVERVWAARTRKLVSATIGAIAVLLLLGWAVRLRRAMIAYGRWAQHARKYLADIGIRAVPDRLRWLFPSRMQLLAADLPALPAWERWGKRAAVMRGSHGPRFHDRDVNRAAGLAHRIGAEIVLLVHDEGASPDLGAIRAILEWAAKGGHRAVHVLPISWERLQWSRGPEDLLDLVEETSLRRNPFEIRGRVQSSYQFFNRERLVSGLLASAQAGQSTLITGLRRFGKSSLALEVGRRLPGPTAYVDLAGFHDEFAFASDAPSSADAILRFVCAQLLDSARVRYPRANLPPAPDADASLDATALAAWFRGFTAACTEANGGRTPPVLLILDELEQAIGVGAERLGHALDVLAILVGRLRNSLSGASFSKGEARVGILLCSALHPLLWAPLGTLAHQSLIGSLESVCVPCLPKEAAASMMRSLGALHGIRFSDAALERIVHEAQGIPLLVRRIGTAVLELYDPERARQGALGAVEIGVEGVATAIEREEEEGSPLRVWIESEIAEPRSPAGAVLRRLAHADGPCATVELRHLASSVILDRFGETGIDRTLPTDETRRRAQDAANLLLRLLNESGLLVTHGDLTSPEAYELPDGVVRRILRGGRPPMVPLTSLEGALSPETPAHGS